MARPKKGEEKYDPSICEKLPQMFANGEEVIEVCRELGIHRSCFYQWIDRYPEFASAYEEAKEVSGLWWLKQARKAASDPEFKVNGSVLIFALKNKLGWHDKQAVEHSGPGGEAIKTESKIEWTIQPVKPVNEAGDE